MKKWLHFIGLALLLTSGFAAGQSCPPSTVNRVPQPGIVDAAGAMHVNTAGLKCTYTAALIGIAPGTSATDFACLIGSSTKTVGLSRVRVSGTAATLVTLPVKIVKNVTVDTGGTFAAQSTVSTAYAHSPTFAAATAVATAYTSAPTITDTSPGVLGISTLTLPLTTSTLAAIPVVFDWGTRGGEARPTLTSAANQFCVSFASTTVATGLVNVDFTWTED